ncbi:NAD(P)/FAD-dependent oxidoreductase [Mesorhizobium abyssinicae]
MKRHLPQLPLAHRSLRLWGGAEKMLGRDVRFRASGRRRQPCRYARLCRGSAALGARAGGTQPGLGPDAIAASFSPHDGSGNPRLIGPAFADAARKLGAGFVENAEVETIKQTGSGFLVTTSKGSFGAESMLNTAGAWGGRIAAQFGETVPLDARGPQMGVTEPLPHRILPVVGIWTRDKGYGTYLRRVERGNIVEVTSKGALHRA